MPPKTRVPKYRHYKPKNLGVVRLNGQDFYLGEYDSPHSWEKYHRLIAEYLSAGGQQVTEPSNAVDGLNINSVLLRYWVFAESYYQRDGEPTKELACMRDALKPLRKLFGSTKANEFGPKNLKTVRDHMIDAQDLCRNEVNKRIGRVKRFFRWAVSEELVQPTIIHGLETVQGLRKNKSRAKEREKVKPVADEDVDATLPFLPPQLVAMINLQRLTGMRPGEVVIMRGCDIDMASPSGVWIFFPNRHKKDWLDQPRAVALGPQCQAILAPFLKRAEDNYCFTPKEAYFWRLDNLDKISPRQRKTKVYPSGSVENPYRPQDEDVVSEYHECQLSTPAPVRLAFAVRSLPTLDH